jgi:hypothetical protein
VKRRTLLRTLRPPLFAVLRRLHLLEPVRRLRMLGVRAAGRELRDKVFGAPDKLPLPPQRLHDLVVGRDDLTIHDYLSIGRRGGTSLSNSFESTRLLYGRLSPSSISAVAVGV